MPSGVAVGVAGHGRPGISPELDLRHEQHLLYRTGTKRKRGPTRLARTPNMGGGEAPDRAHRPPQKPPRPPTTTGSRRPRGRDARSTARMAASRSCLANGAAAQHPGFPT